jgi:hypothetical protein
LGRSKRLEGSLTRPHLLGHLKVADQRHRFI